MLIFNFFFYMINTGIILILYPVICKYDPDPTRKIRIRQGSEFATLVENVLSQPRHR